MALHWNTQGKELRGKQGHTFSLLRCVGAAEPTRCIGFPKAEQEIPRDLDLQTSRPFKFFNLEKIQMSEFVKNYSSVTFKYSTQKSHKNVNKFFKWSQQVPSPGPSPDGAGIPQTQQPEGVSRSQQMS